MTYIRTAYIHAKADNLHVRMHACMHACMCVGAYVYTRSPSSSQAFLDSSFLVCLSFMLLCACCMRAHVQKVIFRLRMCRTNVLHSYASNNAYSSSLYFNVYIHIYIHIYMVVYTYVYTHTEV